MGDVAKGRHPSCAEALSFSIAYNGRPSISWAFATKPTSAPHSQITELWYFRYTDCGRAGFAECMTEKQRRSHWATQADNLRPGHAGNGSQVLSFVTRKCALTLKICIETKSSNCWKPCLGIYRSVYEKSDHLWESRFLRAQVRQSLKNSRGSWVNFPNMFTDNGY